jgi:uncharacterized protein YuzE
VKAEYFQDTDTLLLTFGDGPVVDTRDVGENLLVEFDEAGRLVAITIEHAREQMDLREFTCQLKVA